MLPRRRVHKGLREIAAITSGRVGRGHSNIPPGRGLGALEVEKAPVESVLLCAVARYVARGARYKRSQQMFPKNFQSDADQDHAGDGWSNRLGVICQSLP